MKILDGKALAESMYVKMKEQTDAMEQKPCLAVILVGADPASQVYVNNKKKSCVKAGVRSISIEFPYNILEQEVLKKIKELNEDQTVTGMIVQVPLPSHISEEKVLYAIDPKKDMDGFHPENLGEVYLSKDKEYLPPATPAGIVAMLEANDIEISGKEVVVVGRSNNVGKAVAIMLLNRNATVTVCHSKTQDLAFHTKRADIIIAAVGRPKFITGDMIKDGAVIVDVGIHRIENPDKISDKKFVLCGDVDFDSVKNKVSAISPVPGGVGPMTVASLIQNTLRASK